MKWYTITIIIGFLIVISSIFMMVFDETKTVNVNCYDDRGAVFTSQTCKDSVGVNEEAHALIALSGFVVIFFGGIFFMRGDDKW